MQTSYDLIRTKYLSQDEVDRLLSENPHLKDDPTKFCPTCLTKVNYLWQGEEHECDCQLQLQLYKHYLSAGIGAVYQRLDWVDYQGPKWILEELEKYKQNHKRYVTQGVSLILAGDFGTGKTMLGNLMLKEFVKLGYTCFSTTFASTIDYSTAAWYDDAEKQFFRRKFINSEVLLLDDLGKERRGKTNLAESILDNILRQRIQSGRPTFLTMNMDEEELKEGYGEGILSLLTENTIVYTLSGEDFRPRASVRTRDEIERGEVRPIR